MYARYLKRGLDLFAAVFTLILLAPMLILIAMLIKITDPGPIFFIQDRIGVRGKSFAFFKFRSMPVGTSSLPSDELGEVQMTRIGKLIRRTNVDELPQLVNVLLGDMSLVGPRPPIPSQIDLIELRRKSGAMNCRPGLTGLAQVNAFDAMSIAQKAEYDAHYAANISLVGDIRIVWRTFGYLLRRPPVY